MTDKRIVNLRLPRDQYDRLQQALQEGWRLEQEPEKIGARYADFDLAEQVPRVIMYIDLGTLQGRVRALEAFLVKEGYLLREPPAATEPTTREPTFAIWSIEHQAWWAPGRCGYTRNRAEAGIYPREEAEEILARANIVKVNECLVPADCVG